MLWNVLSLFVYFVSQCIHQPIPTFGRFLVSAAHALAVSAHVHRGEYCASTLPPQSKSAEVMSQLRSTPSAKCTSQENFLATGGCFEHNTYRVTALGWLKKEEYEPSILILDCFRFATLKQLLHIAVITADWGSLYKLLLAFVSWR